MTQYNWQLLCAKQCAKIYIIVFLKKMGFYCVVIIVWLIVYSIMSSNVWVGLVCGGGGLEWNEVI